jgi:hypothetical protein
MADGSAGDLFSPDRLRKLWEPKEEDPFVKREREEKELHEKEPALQAVDLFEEIVRSCRRKLGARGAKLEPVFKHARALLAAKLQVELEAARAAAPPPPPAEPEKKKPSAAAPKTRVEEAKAQSALNDYNRVDRVLMREIDRMKKIAGVGKQDKPADAAALPEELGAALDTIEDLYEALSSGSR